MWITIHRGARQIGGSCVEISTGTTRVILDMGMPLPDGTVGREPYDHERTMDEARGWCEGVQGVFISHYHGDHMGLIEAVPRDVPVYMSEQAIRAYILPQVLFSRVIKRELKPLFGKVRIGDLSVTPFRVDHSAYGAQAFLVTDGTTTLLYSGDIRMHGLAEGKYSLPRGVDYLLIEGTNIAREYSGGLWSEADVRDRFTESFRSHNSIHYVWVSALNIDRMKVLYQACASAGRTLVVDTYTIHILRSMNKKDKSVPFGDDYPLLRTFCPGYLIPHFSKPRRRGIRSSVERWEIPPAQIKADPARYVVAVRPKMEPDIEQIDAREGVFVNSMWQKYEDTEMFPAHKPFIDCIARYHRRHIHTSGHADRAGLRKIVERVAPRCVIPIHTDNPEGFRTLLEGFHVRLLEDGERSKL